MRSAPAGAALLNLVINVARRDAGRRHADDRGTRTCTSQVTPRDHHGVGPGDYVCVSVTDTGTGMSAGVLERAFDPFFTTKPMGQGTGLGLSMVYGFAQQSEGHVRIRSAPGEGATVSLYLPRHGAPCRACTASRAGDAPDAARDGETVLVIEDEASVRSLVVEVLGDLRLPRAGGRGQALPASSSCTSERRIDLLVTDVGLPGMNGRQVADTAREHRPDLKVLFITGYARKRRHGAGVSRARHGNGHQSPSRWTLWRRGSATWSAGGRADHRLHASLTYLALRFPMLSPVGDRAGVRGVCSGS